MFCCRTEPEVDAVAVESVGRTGLQYVPSTAMVTKKQVSDVWSAKHDCVRVLCSSVYNTQVTSMCTFHLFNCG